MIYLLMDEDGDIADAIANVTEQQVEMAHSRVDRNRCRDLDAWAERLGLPPRDHGNYESKAELIAALLRQAGGVSVDIRIWRCAG